MGLVHILLVSVLLVSLSKSYSIKPLIPTNEESSWDSLQTKIEQIINTENKEKSLLDSLVEGKERNIIPTTDSPVVPKISTDESSSDFSLSSTSVSQNHLVTKLLENSQRMESMVVMLVDLKTVLAQAVSSQEKQMALRTEVVELRDEISYLR